MTEYALIAWLWVVLLMSVVWLTYLWLKNPGIIDVAWPLAITIAGLNFLFSTQISAAQFVLMLLLLAWALRLAGYLFVTRIIPKHIDPRYQAISKRWKIARPIGFLANYQMQGVLAVIIAIPFLFISQVDHLGVWQTIAMALIVSGIIGESIADQQLQHFKRKYNNKICDSGLWHYSRHPNYFFEWLIWLGFAFAGLANSLGWIGFVSPVLLLFLMLGVTGPITEKNSIKSKGDDYVQYQRRTSMFIPLPPKQG